MTVLTIFWRFLLLGLVSFGGPAAHIGYFRKAFVEKHQWIDDSNYANLVALCQFLPGPGSSQIGFAIGLTKGGLLGGVAAFIGFTLPSFLLLFALTIIDKQYLATDTAIGIISGLKLLAVVVVADAVYSMGKSFCQAIATAIIAVITAGMLLMFSGFSVQIIALVCAAMVGAFSIRTSLSSNDPEYKSGAKTANVNWLAFATFIVIFLLCVFSDFVDPILATFKTFYQSGSLVFGGGHVVLPLLQTSLAGTVSNQEFLTGYAAAQAVPGPMFTLATFLGGVIHPSAPLWGAIIATVAIFLPGFLLVLAFYRSWQSLVKNPKLAGAVAGINAATVGLLVAAFVTPVVTSSISQPMHVVIVLLGFYLLRIKQLSIVWLVALFVLSGVALQLLSI